MTLSVGTTIERKQDGLRYESRVAGVWCPMDYHCVDCQNDAVLKESALGEFTILTLPFFAHIEWGVHVSASHGVPDYSVGGEESEEDAREEALSCHGTVIKRFVTEWEAKE